MTSRFRGNGPRSSDSKAPTQGAQRPPARAYQPIVTWREAEWQAAVSPVEQALGLSLSPAQQDLLARYMVMLHHWNSTYNLTAVRDAPDMLSHHLADCLAVLAPLGRHLADAQAQAGAATGAPAGQGGFRLLDVGSGGGLPGVVLAICRPEVQVTCVDTVGKKAAFIRQVAAELRLPNLRAEHARVETLKTAFNLITSRAFASLPDFVGLTRSLLAPGAVWMAMKGKLPEDEQAALPADVEVFHVEQLQVPQLDAERCLIWMRPCAAA
ncbi:16S rRNA (guanine(527)-N(7))-methyltransferase RsmG [Aquabacterium sp.]|uniref:16S rRNA (guanine(527)-N(7))-methyltransferase RsmG n=1 Tax=Aquabacterium sp. TaxID=1872578 RepID=UPI0025C473ED|nr:16S rRNA (guanine(527)-N(7))-methyltransferase RsmG [Aquabacterium sp.]